MQIASSVSRFLETTERPGYFVGLANSGGDGLTFNEPKAGNDDVSNRTRSNSSQIYQAVGVISTS